VAVVVLSDFDAGLLRGTVDSVHTTAYDEHCSVRPNEAVNSVQSWQTTTRKPALPQKPLLRRAPFSRGQAVWVGVPPTAHRAALYPVERLQQCNTPSLTLGSWAVPPKCQGRCFGGVRSVSIGVD
jgi:hypothetical protein